MSSPAVVIVGAGAAGIAAARHLQTLRVQTLVLDPAGRPRAGFGDGDDVDDVVFYLFFQKQK
jgi:flavin-dependent dehydrogenase